MSGQTYFVRVGDQVHGPADMNQLAKAAAQSKFGPGDAVSTDRQHWFAAHTLGLPFGAGAAAARAAEDLARDVVHPIDELPEPALAHQQATWSEHLGGGVGLTSGVLLLVALFVPWGPGRKGGQVSMWWDAFGSDERTPGSFQSFLILILLAGIALCVVPLVTRGIARGATMFGIGLIAWIMFIVITVAALADAPGSMVRLLQGNVVLGLLAIITLLGACSASHWQVARPQSLGARVLLCVCGSISLVLMLVSLIRFLTAESPPQSRFGPAAGEWPPMAPYYIVSGVALLAGAILAVISVAPRYSSGRNLVCRWALNLGLGLALFSPAVEMIIALASRPGASSGDNSGWAILLLVRIQLLVLIFATLQMCGLTEMLVSITRPRRASTRAA